MPLRSLTLAKKAFDKGSLDEVNKILSHLIKCKNPEALLLINSFSKQPESRYNFDKRYLKALRYAAKRNVPWALYRLGSYYDMGVEFSTESFPNNKRLATEYFIKAAQLGHHQSQWICAIAFLYGSEFIDRDEDEGKRFLSLSVKGKFIGAYETMAMFHKTGEFGFERSDEACIRFTIMAKSKNVTGYS